MKAKLIASIAIISGMGVLLPTQANAFGLGEIGLSSNLNEYLEAVIPVTELRAGDKNITVKLASITEFNKAGLIRHFFFTKFKFQVVRNERTGATQIKVTSSEPIREPFLDFLLIVSTGRGHLVREYVVLLDPPKSVFVKPTIELEEEPSSPLDSRKVATVVKQRVEYQAQTLPPPPPALVVNNHSGVEGGIVVTRKRDTLGAVAKRIKANNSSMNQVMMALLHENPNAFINSNINSLKSGYSLKVPSIDEINRLSKRQAVAAVREQNDLWRNRNETLVLEASKQKVKPIIDNSLLDSTKNSTRLSLISDGEQNSSEVSKSASLADDEKVQLNGELTLAQEKIESQAQENIELQSRMDMMEEKLESLRRLIMLKDVDLAKVQNSLESDSTEVNSYFDELERINEIAKEEALLNEEIDSDLAEDAELLDNKMSDGVLDEPTTVDENLSDKLADEQELLAEEINNGLDDDLAVELLDPDSLTPNEEAVQVRENEVEIDKSHSSIVETIKNFYSENKQASLIMTVLFFLFLLFRFVFSRQKRDEAEEIELQDLPVNKTDVEKERFTSSDLSVEETKNNDRVDYLDPEEELSDDKLDFNTKSINSALVVESFSPEIENNLTPSSLETELETQVDEELTLPELPISSKLDLEEFSGDKSLDFDFDLDMTEDIELEIASLDEDDFQSSDVIDFSKVDNEDVSLNFPEDVEFLKMEATTPVELDKNLTDLEGEELAPNNESGSVIDFSKVESDELEKISINSPEEVSFLEIEALPAELEIDENIEFDLSSFAGIDEAETKLDLSTAYMDMGDPNGAKSILEEVLKEGNELQQLRAQDLLDELVKK